MDAAATLAAQRANKMDSSPPEEDPSIWLERTSTYLHYIYIYHICGANKETRKIPRAPFCSKVHLCLVSVVGTQICVWYQ